MSVPELFVLATVAIGLGFGGLLAHTIKKVGVASEEAKTISSYISEGARAFLRKEYIVIAPFAALIALVMLCIDWKMSVAFLGGSLFSALAGNIGMRIATSANAKTALAAQESLHKGFRLALSSGTVMGLCVVSLGLLGISMLYFIFRDPQVIYGFGFGASLIALFARVGGGIYTKAADVGADLAGKVEQGIPEDDPRNPAVIADNVGDNVGDVAGMGADLFESYVDAIMAAMVLGTSLVAFGGGAVVFPMFISALGVLASIAGSLISLSLKKTGPRMALNIGIWSTAALIVIASFVATPLFFDSMNVFYAILTGLIAGIGIGLVTEYYTSSAHRPTRNVSQAAESGAGTNVISGLALGMQSTGIPVIIVSVATILSHHFYGLYGVAMAAVGMLSTLGITLAADTYGPVADNAAGIAEMAHLGKETRERAEELDAVGNTTAAMGKGFAVSSAALTAVALGINYAQVARLEVIDLIDPNVLVGVFLGGLLPFVFSSFLLKSVAKAAQDIVSEVRRQWKEIPGLMEGTARPDYTRCVSISTQSALKQMILPGVIALASPVGVGALLGKEALGGFLAGLVVAGFIVAILMANAGGAWDNAKKYIEEGKFGGKGSSAHKAAVVGDTVGDPFKDTAGPSVNILIKLLSIFSLIIVPFL